jgi:predicted RNase H-like HicB family nuclease
MGTGVHHPEAGDRITVTESDGHVVAKDESTGVTSQGRTKTEALANLAEALTLYERPVSEKDDAVEPSDAPWL